MRILWWLIIVAVASGAFQTKAGEFPAVVEHALGQTVVPAEPERIVAMTNRDAETLLALGVVPVGIQSQLGFEGGVGPWAEPLLRDARPEVWLGMEINYEAVVAIDPDLIVFANSGLDAEVYGRLSAIAPTVALPSGAVPWAATPQEMTLTIAQALGREEDGTALNAELGAYLAAQRQRYPVFGAMTLSYLDIFQRSIFAYPADSIVTNILLSVGFKPSAGVASIPENASYLDVSEERLAEFDADVLIIDGHGQSLEALQDELPTFSRLSAVQEGRVLLIEDMALATNSQLSIPYALDRLLPRIAEALEAGE
ncbi:iron-siderophore ABC transporter substrate-binding protein [Pelagibacterium sp. 26DY04]|uniref:iron-siderophore ABC transporter substrate-binding protein n=1 Tax=Pelagibacterium sp. 26DY04 TaxID=2967130 RepID=UPI00281516FF|nr:iron-siderophore ABC transporter substrate-binding protein [Pelagibacterium sp. 26DY04]WMT88715.1 iron-siderophore ABC transporter substrate-binding protein [Pelagibacterium sp. 26DY04]